MVRTYWLLPAALALALGTVGFLYLSDSPADTPASPTVKQTPGQIQLPIAQVVLFSSGVGYFQREGEVEGTTRIDLSFLAGDINDLLKSLVLQDLGGGKISSISYDSQDPVEKTLRSFALDLTSNPTYGEILNQARGEKIEVVMLQTSTSQPSTMTGIIMGMESQRQPAGKDGFAEVELLNLWCAEGMRSVKLTDLQRVRFLNPVIENEVKRALEVLAASHDTQKKSVSLGFSGEGKRPVRVGYVVENPIWKTSYRLVLDKSGKAFLQGWAVIENTSDEDWKDVRMSLVSGRPISFQMNLYQPLYIPRPTVEPELFASLRPPTYSGAMTGPIPAGGTVFQDPSNPAFNRNFDQGFNNRYQRGNAFNPNDPNWGLRNTGTSNTMLQGQMMQNDNNALFLQNAGKLTYEQLQERRGQLKANQEEAKKLGSKVALNPREGIHDAAIAEEMGDYFQYAIDQKVTLPRQKSAMLPIINKDVSSAKVSIFNEGVHAKFPLLGLKFKNTSGNHLMQGPITVYEAGTYAGDSRILDLQPNEERLLSYAIDLGTEVKADTKSAPDQLTSVKIVKGVLHATNKLRKTKTYQVKNRSEVDRALIIEHPFDANWKLVTPEKYAERSRDVYRFEVNVAAGKSVSQEVVEEMTLTNRIALNSTDEKTVRIFVNSPITSPQVKDALENAIKLRTAVAETQRELVHQQQQLKAITDDQMRLRANLANVPPSSDAYKRYLKKFDSQETEIETFQADIKKLQAREKQQQKDYEDYLAGLSIE